MAAASRSRPPVAGSHGESIRRQSRPPDADSIPRAWRVRRSHRRSVCAERSAISAAVTAASLAAAMMAVRYGRRRAVKLVCWRTTNRLAASRRGAAVAAATTIERLTICALVCVCACACVRLLYTCSRRIFVPRCRYIERSGDGTAQLARTHFGDRRLSSWQQVSRLQKLGQRRRRHWSTACQSAGGRASWTPGNAARPGRFT
jgi:hypothetical protein